VSSVAGGSPRPAVRRVRAQGLRAVAGFLTPGCGCGRWRLPVGAAARQWSLAGGRGPAAVTLPACAGCGVARPARAGRLGRRARSGRSRVRGRGFIPSPTSVARSAGCGKRQPPTSGPPMRRCGPGSPPPWTATSSSQTTTPGSAASSPARSATSGRDGPEQVTIRRSETAATRQRAPRQRHCPRRDAAGHSPG
jgi:hypothetical protein